MPLQNCQWTNFVRIFPIDFEFLLSEIGRNKISKHFLLVRRKKDLPNRSDFCVPFDDAKNNMWNDSELFGQTEGCPIFSCEPPIALFLWNTMYI